MNLLLWNLFVTSATNIMKNEGSPPPPPKKEHLKTLLIRNNAPLNYFVFFTVGYSINTCSLREKDIYTAHRHFFFHSISAS